MFLCGQTTEQCGVIAIFLVASDLLCAIIKREKINKQQILGFLFLILGYITLIFSPATMNRVVSETEGALSLFTRFNILFEKALGDISILFTLFITTIILFIKIYNQNKGISVVGTLITFVAFILALIGNYFISGVIFSIVGVFVGLYHIIYEDLSDIRYVKCINSLLTYIIKTLIL